jgi:DNA-binding CsgD family transcriptional regulator
MARKPVKKRPLHDHEIEMIRLIAAGYTNTQLAAEFDASTETIRSRIYVVHRLIGTNSADGSDGAARVRMVAWAYDNRIVRPAGEPELPKPTVPLPQERIPAELAAPMIRLAISILSDEPRGDLKQWARRVMDAARLRVPGALGRPTAVAELCDDGRAAT